MKEQFQLLVDTIDNAHFSYQDFKIDKLNGSRFPVRIYNLEVPFKGPLIKITNELGAQNSGPVSL